MKSLNWEKILCCPTCKKARLKKTTREYRCLRCKKLYPIHQGIPVFADLTHLPEHLKKQVLYFEKEDVERGEFALEPWQKQYVDDFLFFSKLPKHAVIIDNATGSGYMAIELAKKGYFVIATDLTMRELSQLKLLLRKLHLEKKVFLICCSSESLPIRNNLAHGMVANAILEHLPHEKGAIKEIGRVLKKDATLMVAMPIALKYVFPLLWPLNLIHDRRIGHLRRYTREIILRKFSNFKEIRTFYTGHVVKVICSVVYLLTKNKMWLQIAERSDRNYRSGPYWASNVVVILKKI